MPERPSEAFARRMKRYRERRSWTQEAIAAELAAVGWKIDRVQVAKIETGARKVSLDEAIIIAWVLSLPPAFLYLPLGEGDVTLEAEVTIDADGARRWVTGQAPAMNSKQQARLPGEWKADMVVWWLHDDLHEAQDVESRSKSAVRAAEYVGDAQRIEQAKVSHADALLDLAEALNEIRAHGLQPPAIHEKTSEAMQEVGIEYDGPVYPGPRKAGT